MKTLIIYGSYTGVTEDCAKEVSKLLKGEVELINIKTNKFNLDDFKTIVIGTSIRAGNINPKIKKFFNDNKEKLMKKELCIFTSGVSSEDAELQSLQKDIGEELIKHAKVVSAFGGELRMNKLNFLFKFILKKITASQGKKVTDFCINKNSIKEFANVVNK